MLIDVRYCTCAKVREKREERGRRGGERGMRWERRRVGEERGG